MPVAPRRIGELLVAEGLISEASITRALGYQRVSGDRVKLGSILLSWDLLAEEALLAGLAKFHRCPAVPWDTLLATPMETVRLLPAAQALRLGAIPYAAEKGLLRVAFANPSNLAAIDEVSALTRRRVVPGVTTEARLLQAHQKFYGRHVPLEYRPILQKLQRRTTTTLRNAVDFRQSDLIQAERAAAEAAHLMDGPDTTGQSTTADQRGSSGVSIPVEPAMSRDQPLSFPEFPSLDVPDAAAAARPSPYAPSDGAPKMSLRSGDDSLTEWVGRALSSFTGETPDEADPSSAGVSDPSQFGRSVQDASEDPGALDLDADSLPATNAFRSRPSQSVQRPTFDAPSEAHTRGVPTSIPPFRRSTDPRIPSERADPLDHEDDVVAGMWRHDAAEPGSQPEGADGRSLDGRLLDQAPSLAERLDEAAATAAAASSTGAAESSSSAARSRDEIADSILQGALEQLPRVLLLGTGKTGVTGWRGRGPGLTPEIIAAIRIPNSELSVFSSVQQSSIPHFGAIDRAEWPGSLSALFGSTPPDCAIFPIRMLDGVAAFLYADRLGRPMQYEDFAVIARTAASAANVMSRFLLRNERASSEIRR